MTKNISNTDFNQIIEIYKKPENKNRMISPRDGRHEKEIIEYCYQFYNQRKDLFFKTYDKLFELEERGIPYELPHGHGLLRYEISMIRKFLAKKYGNLIDNSYALLAEVNHDKELLIEKI